MLSMSNWADIMRTLRAADALYRLDFTQHSSWQKSRPPTCSMAPYDHAFHCHKLTMDVRLFDCCNHLVPLQSRRRTGAASGNYHQPRVGSRASD